MTQVQPAARLSDDRDRILRSMISFGSQRHLLRDQRDAYAGAIFLVIMAEGNYRPSQKTLDQPQHPPPRRPLFFNAGTKTHVPRRDDPDDSDRLLDRDVPQAGNRAGDGISVVPHGLGGEPFEERGRVEVFAAGVSEGFSILGGLQSGVFSLLE
jgi:hypothetical protein